MSVLTSDNSKMAANCPNCGDIILSVDCKIKREEHGIDYFAYEDSGSNKKLLKYCPICSEKVTLFFDAETMACYRKSSNESHKEVFDKIMMKQQKELDEKMNESPKDHLWR